MKKLKKELIAEDCCFACKDGGQLLICDYGDCLKSYHLECEKREESVLKSKQRWTCRWHYCRNCFKPSKIQCFTCPAAECGLCFDGSDFAYVRGSKGFCRHCLRLAILIEDNLDIDSDGEGAKVDFHEEATYEQFFKQYYQIMKEKGDVTAEMTRSAMTTFKQGKKIRLGADIEDVDSSDDDEIVSDYDAIGDEPPKQIRKKRKRPSEKVGGSHKSKSKAAKWVGWATGTLVDFLKSIGEDATKPLPPCEVESIVRKYSHVNKLVERETVFCDEMLLSLFRKKSIRIHRISKLLEPHFAESAVHTERENNRDISSSDEEENIHLVSCQIKKQTFFGTKSSDSETPSTMNSCYASIVAENIKLIYLRKTLVAELLKEPGTFQDKIVGSIVRIKSDPCDYLQKHSHQLMRVTGLNESTATGENRFELQVSNRRKLITVSDISDEDYSFEECDDLRRRMENGLLEKVTVVDLEMKARMLHEDITKHWITRQLGLLQKQIDRANKKGWRRELNAYLERKELLKSEAEQSRLLQDVPVVIVEEIPVTDPERVQKMDSKFPRINGGQSAKHCEEKESQAKEGLEKFRDPSVLSSLVEIPIVDDHDAILDDLEQLVSGNFLSKTSYIPAHPGVALAAEKASPAPSTVSEMKKIFMSCLELDFPALFTSDKQSYFLESLLFLSQVEVFSSDQTAAMKNLLYEFPKMTSNYQYAEDTASVFQRFMQSHGSDLEVAKQYKTEYERVEAQEFKLNENSIKIETEIRQLQQKLEAMKAEKEKLLFKKLELASKIKVKAAELSNFRTEASTWNHRQRKATEERETVCFAWQSFKSHFHCINNLLTSSSAPNDEEAPTVEKVPQQQPTYGNLEHCPPSKAPQANGKPCQADSDNHREPIQQPDKPHNAVHDLPVPAAKEQLTKYSPIWYHFSSSGKQHGPLSISILKTWSARSDYASNLKVWRSGQTPEQAIPIADAISLFFP